MRKTIFTILIVLCVLVVAIPVIADSEIGRYQAIRMDASAVFIIDTKDGHLWIWAAKTNVVKVVYLGIVKPGKEMWETIWEAKLFRPESK